jgi:hypothetical protein
MPENKARSLPSLFLMQQVHFEDGSSLSVGRQLHWFLQLQVLFKHAILLKHFVHPNRLQLQEVAGGDPESRRYRL